MNATAGMMRAGCQHLACRVPALLREVTFRRYWSAQTISMFGDQITSVALPFTAVLGLHAGAAQMGYLTAAVWLPSLLFGMHAGAWADRLGRRRILMISADIGRAVMLASVPACYALHVLTLGQLYGVAFGGGALSTLFMVSDSSLSVAVMPDDRYVEGNSLIYASRAFSFVGGPSLGGLLVQVFSAPFALAADALSFFGSAFFLHRIKPAEAPADRTGKGALSAGARFILHSPIIRPSLMSCAVINLFNFMYLALLILYATRVLRVRPGLLGLVLGAAAVGGVIGSLITKRLAARVGIGWAYVIGGVLFIGPLALVPLASGPPAVVLTMLFAAEFGSGFGVMLMDISLGSIFAAVIPADRRSRVSGAFQAINYGTRPIGALLGGTLGTLIGLRPTLWIAVLGGVSGFLLVLHSTLPRFRMPTAAGDQAATARLPAPPQAPAPAGRPSTGASRVAVRSHAALANPLIQALTRGQRLRCARHQLSATALRDFRAFGVWWYRRLT